MANLITVADLMTPLGPELVHGEHVSDAFVRIMEKCSDEEIPYDPMSRVSLVRDEEEVVGVSYLDLLVEDKHVGDPETIEKIRPNRIIASNTNMHSFIATMPDDLQYYYLVLDSTQFVGSLELSDLGKLPFRLCILALTLDLEKKITEYALKDPPTSWGYLPLKRQKSAKRLHKSVMKVSSRRSSSNIPPTTEMLLDYTSYSDKCTILKSYGIVSSLHDIVDTSIKFRNSCSHSTEDKKIYDLLRTVNIKEFTQKLSGMNHELQKLIVQ